MDDQPLADLPSGVRPAVPPPPPSYQAGLTARVTAPLNLRETRPLAWTEVANRLGAVEPLAIESAWARKKPAWTLGNPLWALKKKLDDFKKS
jgi:hypothetical protein